MNDRQIYNLIMTGKDPMGREDPVKRDNEGAAVLRTESFWNNYPDLIKFLLEKGVSETGPGKWGNVILTTNTILSAEPEAIINLYAKETADKYVHVHLRHV